MNALPDHDRIQMEGGGVHWGIRARQVDAPICDRAAGARCAPSVIFLQTCPDLATYQVAMSDDALMATSDRWFDVSRDCAAPEGKRQ